MLFFCTHILSSQGQGPSLVMFFMSVLAFEIEKVVYVKKKVFQQCLFFFKSQNFIIFVLSKKFLKVIIYCECV